MAASVYALVSFVSALDAQGPSRRHNAIAGEVRLGRTILTLGDEDAATPTTFGGIASVALDKDGTIYVLDYGDNSIRVFDRRGRFVTRAGRPGRGPGDLAAPNRLLHDGDSTLYVTDEVNGVVVFRTGGGVLRHVRTFGADLRPRSACVYRGGLVIGGYRDQRIFHFVSSNGEIVRSGGDPFPFRAPIQIKARVDTIVALRELANRASVVLVCAEADSLLIVAQASGPGIRAYRADGALAWEHQIPEYAGSTYFTDSRGAPIIAYGKDVTLAATLLDAQTLLVQFSHRETGSTGSGRTRRIVSRQLWLSSTVLDLRTGQVRSTSRSLPLLLAVRGPTAIEMEEEPFPLLRVRSIEGRK